MKSFQKLKMGIMGKVIICMPEYNEGSVLFDFVDEIKAQLLDVNFVIVDDNSSQEFKDQMINRDLPLVEMLPYLFALIVLVLIGIMPGLFLEKITW
jgi:glycosyltransferase involved in cell wall biosynthesis